MRCYCDIKEVDVTKLVFALNFKHFARFLGSLMERTRRELNGSDFHISSLERVESINFDESQEQMCKGKKYCVV